MANFRLFIWVGLFALLMTSIQVSAATYHLVPGSSSPPICNGSEGSWSGNTYICNWGQPLSLQPDDVVTSSTNITILSNSGFTINGATLGSESQSINLSSNNYSLNDNVLNNTTMYGSLSGHNIRVSGASTIYGGVDVSQTLNASQSSGSTIHGNVNSGTLITNNMQFSSNISASNNITLENTSLSGSILSGQNLTLIGTSTINGSVNISGSMDASQLSSGTISGNVTASNIIASNTAFGGTVNAYNGTLNLTSSSVAGEATGRNGVTATDTIFQSTLTSIGGTVNLAGGDVTGHILAECCKVTVTNGAVIGAGITAGVNGIEISDSEVTGDLNAGNNPIILTNVTMHSGNISAGNNNVTVNGGEINASIPNAHRVFIYDSAVIRGDILARYLVELDNSTVYGNIETTENHDGLHHVTLHNSEVYGNVTVRDDWGTITGNWPNSAIYGNCTYHSVTPELCSSRQPPPPQCFADTFTSGSNFSRTWAVSRSQGNFNPQIINSRLRLTEDRTNQATRTTMNRIFPAQNNRVEIEFDYFAYGGNGADGIAIVLSDASVSPQPGGYGGSLGYAQGHGEPGFAGGWLGIGLDEYGNFSMATEGRQGGYSPSWFVSRRPNRVVIRGSGSGNNDYRFLRDSAQLNPALHGNPNTAHRYRIVIDSRGGDESIVSVERKVGSADYQMLIAPFDARSETGQASVPERFFISFTGSTGAQHNIHELGEISVRADQCIPILDEIHHYQLDFAADALTCRPQSVAVRACLDASCSNEYQQATTVTLTPSQPGLTTWLPNPTVSFVSNSSLELSHVQPGPITLGVANPSIPASYPTQCRIGGGAASTNCTVEFADSGFIFDVPDHHSNTLVEDIVMRAVRRDGDAFDPGTTCVPNFQNETRRIRFSADFIDPETRIVETPLRIDDIVIPDAMNLAFNNEGEARFSLQYPDAGEVQLNAALDEPGGLIMRGSDRFVARPVGLCIRTAEGACPANDETCNVFRRTGEAFDLLISAHGVGTHTEVCQNPATPNFRISQLNLNSQFTAPADGVNGQLSQLTYSHQQAVDSVNTVANSYSEVGVARFEVTQATPYFGYTDIAQGTSVPTGRFVPHEFTLTGDQVLPACNGSDGFTYYGQPFRLSGTITALNHEGQPTFNYRDQFAKASLVFSAEDSTDLTSRLSPAEHVAADAVWIDGSYAFDIGLTLNRDTTWPEIQRQVAIGIAANDNDGNHTLLNPTASQEEQTHSDGSVRLSGNNPSLFYFGRLNLTNIAGPEDEDLFVQGNVEYWDGHNFIRNLYDHCTLINSQYFSAVDDDPRFEVMPEDFSDTTETGRIRYPVYAIEAPGEPREYYFEYTAPEYLQFNWQDEQANSHLNPRALATFGQYRGNDRVIIWLEQW